MGCGCKNKGNQTQQTPESVREYEAAKQKVATERTAQLKESIKKTVEKYYNVNKNNTNGYTK